MPEDDPITAEMAEISQLGCEPRGHSVKQLWFLSTEDIFQHSIFFFLKHT